MSTQTTSKPDILAKIEVYKRQEISPCQGKTSVEAMRKLARQAPALRGFAAAIENHLSSGSPAMIAEIKKSRPVKRADPTGLRSSALARAYVEGGANCLSVLTDEPFFPGPSGLPSACARNFRPARLERGLSLRALSDPLNNDVLTHS